MVFLINHNADRLILVQYHGPAPGIIRQIRTDEMLLHQHLFIKLSQLIKPYQLKGAEPVGRFSLKYRGQLLKCFLRLFG
ncbi:hypothetical protein D3C73_1418650 [compost metagenome]